METKGSANFRKIPKPNCCETCANTGHYESQGWSVCTALKDTILPWSEMQWITCNCWKAKYVPTERERVLAKLSNKDREILGLT